MTNLFLILLVGFFTAHCSSGRSDKNSNTENYEVVEIQGQWSTQCIAGFNRSVKSVYLFNEKNFLSRTEHFTDENCKMLNRSIEMSGTYEIESPRLASNEQLPAEAWPLNIYIHEVTSTQDADTKIIDTNMSFFTIFVRHGNEIFLGQQKEMTPNTGMSREFRHNAMGQTTLFMY